MSGRGLAQKSLDLIEASRIILEQTHPNTVRGVCYQLFIQKMIPDMSRSSTAKVSAQLVNAREMGIIPWEHIVDETRAPERISAWSDLNDYSETVLRAYRKDFWERQPCRIEVCSEKGTVRGVLAPVLDEFAITFHVFHGFGGATAVHDLAESSAGMDEPLILLYVGDYDPSGMCMSEKDLPERLDRYDGNVSLQRIALVENDCTSHLPSFRAAEKRKDPRYRWFVDRYGGTCWELDAMDPNVLRDRVRDAILGLIDRDAWSHCLTVQHAERESLKTFFENFRR